MVEPELIRRPDIDDEDAAKQKFYVREWLNLPGYHSIAFILAEVREGRHGAYVSLDIGDCSRSISLSFGMYDEGDRKNTMHKLDLLVDTLVGFRDAVRVECERVAALEAEKPT